MTGHRTCRTISTIFFNNFRGHTDDEHQGARSKNRTPGGLVESEGGVGKVSVRRIFRYLQIDTGPRRSPSACSSRYLAADVVQDAGRVEPFPRRAAEDELGRVRRSHLFSGRTFFPAAPFFPTAPFFPAGPLRRMPTGRHRRAAAMLVTLETLEKLETLETLETLDAGDTRDTRYTGDIRNDHARVKACPNSVPSHLGLRPAFAVGMKKKDRPRARRGWHQWPCR